MISGRETAFSFCACTVATTEADSLQLEVCCFDIYRKLQKKLMAGNLSYNTNANNNNNNEMKTSTYSQMPALNDSSKEIHIFIWV